MGNMFSKTFWIDTFERAIKTFAQSAVAVIGANAMGVLDVDWIVVASVAGLAAFVSVLTSIASAQSWIKTPITGGGTASMAQEVMYDDSTGDGIE